MYFKRLRYISYRNLEQVELEPVPGFNIFWGRNGQGKTNLIEGIYLLGHLKSFRSAVNNTLITDQKTQAAIESELTSGRVVHQLKLELNARGKEIRLDGKRPQRIAEVAEKLRQVLFSPEEVTSVKGAPGLRRNLLDRAVFQLQPHYLERMQSYYRLLKQRNHLLRSTKDLNQIDIWSEKLIEEGARIRLERQSFIKKLDPYFKQCYAKLTASQEKPQMRLRQNSADDFEEHCLALSEELARCKEQEIFRHTTLAGPHRDDPQFFVNEQELRSHGSQGQQRTFILAFKIALMKLLREQTGRTAVLMLDDITSELDGKRRKALFEMLNEGAGQVFVTTTDPELVADKNTDNCRFFEVRQGQVFTS